MTAQDPPRPGPRLTVTPDGPYRLDGDVEVRSPDGRLLHASGPAYLCRCGGSRSKPFCDVTHGFKDFDGTESADRGPSSQRRDEYPRDGAAVLDDRSVCAHSGQCTDRLPRVFRADAEPFVDADGADLDTVREVVSGCPSGALAFRDSTGARVEPHATPSVTPVVDGPYRVRGVQVVGADGEPYEARERQTLCRCGHSRNKPFCDGSHWYAGFRDPLPPELRVEPPTLYEWIGGIEALERLTETFYASILDESDPDPVLEPVFRGMDSEHPRHVAAWLGETFGGPPTYTTEHGGYEHMVARHHGLGLTEQQRTRWLTRMVETADAVGLPDDPDFRSTFVAYLEWGTRIAVWNSAADATVVPHAPVPRWGWGQTPPFTPQPWDDPDAASRGRARYAAEQERG